MKHIRLIPYLLILCIVLTSCKPKVELFDVTPNRICEGQEVTVNWKVKGKGLLNANPAINNTGPVASQGSAGFSPINDTVFKITAMRNGKDQAYAEAEVLVFENLDQKKLVFKTEPFKNSRLLASGVLNPEVWDDVIKIDTITNLSDRQILIVHDNKEANLLSQNISTELFRGTKLSGKWEIFTDLLPGEIIGDPSNAPPDRLGILVTLICINNGE